MQYCNIFFEMLSTGALAACHAFTDLTWPCPWKGEHFKSPRQKNRLQANRQQAGFFFFFSNHLSVMKLRHRKIKQIRTGERLSVLIGASVSVYTEALFLYGCLAALWKLEWRAHWKIINHIDVSSNLASFPPRHISPAYHAKTILND